MGIKMGKIGCCDSECNHVMPILVCVFFICLFIWASIPSEESKKREADFKANPFETRCLSGVTMFKPKRSSTEWKQLIGPDGKPVTCGGN